MLSPASLGRPCRTVSQHHSFLAQEVKRQQELPSQADIVDEWLTTVIQFGWVAPPAILPRSRVVTVLCVCVCARARARARVLGLEGLARRLTLFL